MNESVARVPVRQWKRWLTLLLVGLVLRIFDLRVSGVDLLPDLGGRVVLLVAALAVPATPRLPRLRALAVVAAVLGVVLDVVGRLGADVAVAAGVADDALVLSAAALAIRLAVHLELESRRRELMSCLVLFAVAAAATTAAQLLEPGVLLSFAVGVTALAALVALLVLLFLLRRDLRGLIRADGAAAVPQPAC